MSSTTDNPPQTLPPKQQGGVAMYSYIFVAIVAVAIGVAFSSSNPEAFQDLIQKLQTSLSSSATTTTTSTQTSVWTITPNSTGLLVDASIYETYLGSQLSMLEKPPPQEQTEGSSSSCVYIFLEVTPKTPKADMHRRWIPHAMARKTKDTASCRVMAMANTDQFTIDMLDLPNLEVILCKTRQCVQWVQKKQEEQAKPRRIPILYSGFTSIPPSTVKAANDEDLERFGKFIHVAGRSPHKGTWNVLQAWLQHPHWPQLTLTSYNNQMVDTVLGQMKQQLGIRDLPRNIHHINKRLSREEIDTLMHSHGVHLCLSGMEGFGHYINEARALGALVMASNYPAMNELITADADDEKSIGVLLEPTNMLEWTNGLPFANIGAPEVARVMNQIVLPMSLQERRERGQRAKEAYERDRIAFQERMKQFRCYVEQCNGEDQQKQAACAKNCGLELE